jgi:prephenate dehydrogenase
MFGKPPYRCVGIVGTGLIGGSLGLALHHAGIAEKIFGCDADAVMLDEALNCGAVDQTVGSAAELAASCDLVFIAVPVRSIPGVFKEIAPSLKPGTTLSDVGSVKEKVVRSAMDILPRGCHFIGGHPLAGSEQRGVEFADPYLFRDAYYVLTPTSECDADAYSRLHALLTSIGARVIAMDPTQHDRAVSVISHLPHIMAMGLMNLALGRAEEYPLLRLAAGGFRDMTRIAASNPDIWLDIIMDNREAVQESLEECISTMRHLEELLKEGREDELTAWMQNASTGRQNLAPALKESLADLYSLTLAVEDRPGVLSDVTLTVGEMGINIVDIELVHPLESGQGLLKVSISGEDAAQRAAEALKARGYRLAVTKTLGGE